MAMSRYARTDIGFGPDHIPGPQGCLHAPRWSPLPGLTTRVSVPSYYMY